MRLPWYFTVFLLAIGVLLAAWVGLRVASGLKRAGVGPGEFSEFTEKVFTKGTFGALFALGLLLLIGLAVHHFVLGIGAAQLSDGGVMRGWVTLLFSIVGAAMFMSVAVGAFAYPDLDKEAFERVRGVMTQLVTILGIVIGFYFGAVTVERNQNGPATLALEFSALPTTLTPSAGESVLVPLDVTATGGAAPYRWELSVGDTPLALAPEVESAAASGRLTGSLWIEPAEADRLALRVSVRDHKGHSHALTHTFTLTAPDAPVIHRGTIAVPAGGPDVPAGTTG